MSIRRICVSWIVVATFLVGSSPPAFATEGLRDSLTKIAASVGKLLSARSIDSVSIGQFSGPPSFASASGPGIRQVLTEEFQKLNIRVKRLGAPFGVQGKYFIHQPPGGDNPQFRIQAEVVDANGEVLAALNGTVKIGENNSEGLSAEQVTFTNGRTQVIHDTTDAGDIADTLGATVDVHATEQRGEIGNPKSVIDSFRRPTATIHKGTAVGASRSSPFTLEVLVNNRPRPVKLVEGQPFVTLKKGDAFHLRYTNNARFATVVRFLLDGINSFSFSELRHNSGHRQGESRYVRWLINPGQSITLKGWHRNNKSVDEFLVTNLADSAAARLGSPTGVGTISVCVQATWLKTESPPADEIQVAFSKTPSAIGFGRRLEQIAAENNEPRKYGRTRAVITIRYDKP